MNERRELLLRAAAKFLASASRVSGVTRIALVGSLTTPKPNPKDADVLVSIGDDADLAELALLGRQFKGGLQSHNLGADIFLASNEGKYLGRTCSFRECHARARCFGRHCAPGVWINDDLDVVTLSDQLVAEPPLELWPRRLARVTLPDDVQRLFLSA